MCKHAQGKVPRNGIGGGAKGGELTKVLALSQSFLLMM